MSRCGSYRRRGCGHAPAPGGCSAEQEMRTVGNRTCSTSSRHLLHLLQSALSAAACAALTCIHTRTHTREHPDLCTCISPCVFRCSLSPPQVVLSEVRADLAGEGGGFDSQWVWLPQTEVAFKRPVVEILHAHHHPRGVRDRRRGHSGG